MPRSALGFTIQAVRREVRDALSRELLDVLKRLANLESPLNKNLDVWHLEYI